MTLDAIEASNLTAGKHAFFSARGGVSTGIYASLNCGAGSADDPASVARNRTRVGAQYDVAPDHVISVHQIHSAKAIVVNGPFSGDKPQCDGMVTTTPGLVLGALCADCAPVLLEDRASGVVAAAHAGWRGALAGICAATIETMVAEGAKLAQITAAVGPCLSQRNYEVGPEFFEDFIAQDDAFARYFAGGSGDRMQFDLPGFVLGQLRATGIASASWTGHCTYADPDRFFSYRRGCHQGLPDYGRLIATITV